MTGAAGRFGLRMTRPWVSVWSSVAPCSRSRSRCGDDDLETVVRAHLVGERGRQVLVEAEVVAEVLTGRGGDLQAQTELVGVGFGVAQLDELGEGGRRDLDDRLAPCRGGGGAQAFEGTHAFRLPPVALRHRRAQRIAEPPPSTWMRWPVT